MTPSELTLNLPSTSIMKKSQSRGSSREPQTSLKETKDLSSALKYKPILKNTSVPGCSSSPKTGSGDREEKVDRRSISISSGGGGGGSGSGGGDGGGGGGGNDSTSLIGSIDFRSSTLRKSRGSAATTNGDTASSTNLSIMNESDSVSTIMRLRQENKESRPYSIKYDKIGDINELFYTSSNTNLSANNSSSGGVLLNRSTGSHFSPRSSMKIRVIDETDTDNI